MALISRRCRFSETLVATFAFQKAIFSVSCGNCLGLMRAKVMHVVRASNLVAIISNLCPSRSYSYCAIAIDVPCFDGVVNYDTFNDQLGDGALIQNVPPHKTPSCMHSTGMQLRSIDLPLKHGRDMIRPALRLDYHTSARIQQNVNPKPLARDAANTSNA